METSRWKHGGLFALAGRLLPEQLVFLNPDCAQARHRHWALGRAATAVRCVLGAGLICTPAVVITNLMLPAHPVLLLTAHPAQIAFSWVQSRLPNPA